MVTMRIGLWHNEFNFRNWHKWEEAEEKKEEHAEQAKGAKEGQDIDHSRRVVTPACWQEVIGQRCDCNHKTFKPHADINEN